MDAEPTFQADKSIHRPQAICKTAPLGNIPLRGMHAQPHFYFYRFIVYRMHWFSLSKNKRFYIFSSFLCFEGQEQNIVVFSMVLIVPRASVVRYMGILLGLETLLQAMMPKYGYGDQHKYGDQGLLMWTSEDVNFKIFHQKHKALDRVFKEDPPLDHHISCDQRLSISFDFGPLPERSCVLPKFRFHFIKRRN